MGLGENKLSADSSAPVVHLVAGDFGVRDPFAAGRAIEKGRFSLPIDFDHHWFSYGQVGVPQSGKFWGHVCSRSLWDTFLRKRFKAIGMAYYRMLTQT